jgi:hypothetical protein
MRMGGRGPLTGDLVLGVLLAVLALAVGSAGLGNVDLGSYSQHLSFNAFKDSPYPAVATNARRATDVGDDDGCVVMRRLRS